MTFLLLINNCCSGSSYQIVLGANRYDASESGSQMVASTYSIVHSAYNPNTIDNDIAVIRLPFTVGFTSEYCHTVMNMNIILLIIKQINCFLFTTQTSYLFNSSVLLKIYQSFEHPMQCCYITSIQQLPQLKL